MVSFANNFFSSAPFWKWCQIGVYTHFKKYVIMLKKLVVARLLYCHCGGLMKIISFIYERKVIKKILDHPVINNFINS